MKEIKENKFGNEIEKNDRIKVGIQKPTTTKKHWSNHAGKKQGFKHHADGKK